LRSPLPVLQPASASVGIRVKAHHLSFLLRLVH
jgi:hypothetical protein